MKKSPLVFVLVLAMSLLCMGCTDEEKVRTQGKLVINEVYLNGCNSSEIHFISDDDSWLEIYNPNDFSIDVSTYCLYYPTQICPRYPHIILKGNQYIIFCKNLESFKEHFSISKIVGVYEYESAFSSNTIGVYNDVEETGFEDYLVIESDVPQDHSLARFQSGFDTDTFANDFYFDPNPTPGWENNRVK